MATNNQPTIHRGLALAIVMLDDLQHQLPEHPFCSDRACPCEICRLLWQNPAHYASQTENYRPVYPSYIRNL